MTLEQAAAPSPAKVWLKALELTARLDADPARTFPVAIEAMAARTPDAPALIADAERLNYGELAQHARRYAAWAQAEGLTKGDVVALMMGNQPEYLAIWLGLTRIGVVAALINPQLRGPSLAHCLGVAGATRVIVEETYTDEVAVAVPALGAEALWTPARIAAQGSLPFAEPSGVTLNDTALLIYTSGTTGLPKAARVSHRRVMTWAGWFAGMMGATAEDRLYDCLPMCHSVGGVAAPCALLLVGGSVVVREKFSAKAFWDDVVRHRCTLFQYIGELCRYLLTAPEHPAERLHSLRMACGNGLRPDVWEPFQARFGIPRILEFYASTEGNVSLYNVEGRPGAIGRIPPFLAARFAPAIVRFDEQAGAPARGEDGLCVPCERGGAGEALGRIDAANGRFEGYTDAAESDRKVLRDVLSRGDAWFRTGDLMRMDAQGYYHFVGRIGETFRWKGENVATAEVEAALSDCPGVREAVVYGVSVPGADGQAGMAAVVLDDECDVGGLAAALDARLPGYALPVFLRRMSELPRTETFKHKKAELARAGFTGGPVWVLDRPAGGYVPLDEARREAIGQGRGRL